MKLKILILLLILGFNSTIFASNDNSHQYANYNGEYSYEVDNDNSHHFQWYSRTKENNLEKVKLFRITANNQHKQSNLYFLHLNYSKENLRGKLKDCQTISWYTDNKKIGQTDEDHGMRGMGDPDDGAGFDMDINKLNFKKLAEAKKVHFDICGYKEILNDNDKKGLEQVYKNYIKYESQKNKK